jgi:hypothetical protein
MYQKVNLFSMQKEDPMLGKERWESKPIKIERENETMKEMLVVSQSRGLAEQLWWDPILLWILNSLKLIGIRAPWFEAYLGVEYLQSSRFVWQIPKIRINIYFEQLICQMSFKLSRRAQKYANLIYQIIVSSRRNNDYYLIMLYYIIIL